MGGVHYRSVAGLHLHIYSWLSRPIAWHNLEYYISPCLLERCPHYELQHNINISQYARSNSTDVTDMHISLSSDTTTNIAFGLFMAVLGLVAVYQGARYAARHIGQ